MLNAVSFFLMVWDKVCAIRGMWRVRERTLLLWAFFGGALGTKFAQKALRHKTTKQPFANTLNVVLVWNMIALTILSGFMIFADHERVAAILW
ncbi:DUF1294 domain-containing protein [Roseobacteraceae bacterium S113]